MSGDVTIPAKKMTWFIVFGAMTFAMPMYGLVCFFVAQSRTVAPSGGSSETLLPVFYMLGGMALLTCVAWMHWRTRGKIGDVPAAGTGGGSSELMPPSQFQFDSIVALALGEICAILGVVLFLLGAPITEFMRFAAATLAVYLFYILPRGIKYWTAWEAPAEIE